MTASFVSVDQLEEGHTLVLGTTGSGKTYQVRGMLEQLRRADRRVGAIDKLGNHWGLTLGRDGKAAGLDFVIFGGKRAQVPMTPDQGAAIGELFVARHIPAIFDISQWAAEDQEEWIAAFATTVFRVNEGALHLSIDEAQSFVPTNGGGDAYKAVRLLAEQGRGNGLRLLLACQRLSRLDSTVREMMHTVVVMRQTGPIDRRAVKDLISADREQGELIERELPKLPVGTGFVWQAGGVDLRRIRFGENTTFDSSRTPKHGDAPPPPVAVSSDLVEQLRAALAPAEPEPHPDDVIPANPAEAYAKGSEVGAVIRERDERIAWLEEQLAAATKANAECADMVSASITREFDVAELLQQALGRLHWPHSQDKAEATLENLRQSAPVGSPAGVEASPAAGPCVSPTAGGADLPPRRTRILGAIAWSAAYLKRENVARTVVAWIAGTTARSSTFERDCGALRTAGLVEYPAPGELRLTDDGAEVTPRPTTPRSRDALRQAIADQLEPRRVRILDALIGGSPVRTRVDLAAEVGTTARSSTFERDLGALRTLGLIHYPEQGVVQLAELLR